MITMRGMVAKDGEIIGAISGIGGTGQQDEDCARVGLAVLKPATGLGWVRK